MTRGSCSPAEGRGGRRWGATSPSVRLRGSAQRGGPVRGAALSACSREAACGAPTGFLRVTGSPGGRATAIGRACGRLTARVGGSG